MKNFLLALVASVMLCATPAMAVDVQHSTLSGTNLHQAFHYEQAGDPGAVGANKWWYKTDTKQLYRRNGANNAWDLVVTVPGANTQVVFNDGGTPGADTGLTYNKTTDVLTVTGGVVANLSGNATTATALAADGTDCPLGQAARGTDASGNAQGCFTPEGVPGSGIISLNGLNPTAQTFANDFNVIITSSGSVHTIGWSGQLAINRGGTNAATAADARTNLDVQQKDTDLQALADATGTGLWTRTGIGTGQVRTIQSTAGQTTVSNGSGVNADPQIGLATGIIDGSNHSAADSGSTDDYVITVSPAPSSYINGAWYRFKPNTANTGAATLNVNSLGAKTIKKLSSGSYVDLATGDICVGNGQQYEVVYDGVNFLMQSPPCSGAGGGTPGGSNTQVQYNNAGAFAGDAGMTYDAATDVLTLAGGLVAGNCATNCLTHDTSAVTGSKTATWPNVTGTVQVNGAVSIDAETSGNTLTVPVYITWEAAGCNNATAGTNMDLPTSGAPTATCFGTTTTQGTLSFVDAATNTATRHFRLPSDWSGNVDVDLVWFANAASANAVRWSVATGCVADSEAVSTGPSYNTASASNTAYTGTANQRKTTSFTSVSMTNCAVSETLYLQVQRIGGDAGDTLTATAELLEVGVKLRRAM